MPGSSVHGILQARILEWFFISFSRGSSQPLLNLQAFGGWALVSQMGFPGGADDKESAYNVGDPGLIPGSGRSPGEGNGNPLQYSCLEYSMDRRAWWATVHGAAKNWT